MVTLAPLENTQPKKKRKMSQYKVAKDKKENRNAMTMRKALDQY